MPLYDNSTNLAAQGKFAPGVNYRADIRKPTQSMPSFPKGQYQFNVNLDSIGNALSQMSRDQADVEKERFKFEYAQKEKADKAAEKQLKLDMSNAYAQELADVTAQVDQGIINPLDAARRVKAIDDKYRTYGVLSPSEMAPIRNNYDGGVSQYQEKTREQLRQSEIAFDESHRQELINAVPSVAGLPRDQQLMLWYNLNNADLQLNDAVKIYNSNPSSDNQTLLQSKADGLADYQTRTIFMNALNNDNRYSEADMFNMAVGGVDRALAERGVTNPQMRAYAATKAYGRYQGLAEAKQKYSDEMLKYLKNRNGIYDEETMYAMRVNDPLTWAQVLAEKNNISLMSEDEIKARSFNINEGLEGEKRLYRFGGYVKQGTGYTVNAEGDIEDYVNSAVPSDYREFVLNSNMSPEAKATVLGQSAIPVGQLGEAGSRATVSGLYDRNVVVPGTTLYGSSMTPEQISTAFNNNSNYMQRTKDNPVTMQNMQKQDEYAGTNRVKELADGDRRKVYDRINDIGLKTEADSIHSNDVLPFSPSGQYAALYNSLVIDENTGTLSMLNKYRTSGNIEKAAALFTAYNGKQSVKNINDFARKVFPDDAEGRVQIIRSLFDRMYPANIPSYSYGMGGATIKPTMSEKAAAVGLDIGQSAAKGFSENVLPELEKGWEVAKKGIKKTYDTVDKKLDEVGANIKEDFIKEKENDPNLTPAQYIRDKVVGILQSEADTVLDGVQTARQLSRLYLTGASSDLGLQRITSPEEAGPNIGTQTVNWISNKLGLNDNKVKKPEEAYDFDLQTGTLNYKEPLGLPFRINEDGTWSNMLYGTVSADGRTYVAPGLDDKGELSTPEDEFKKGRYFFSVKGTDENSINTAEELASRLREYVINLNEPYIESLAQPLGGLSETVANMPVNNLSEDERNVLELIGNEGKEIVNEIQNKITGLKAGTLIGFTEHPEAIDMFIEGYNSLENSEDHTIKQALYLISALAGLTVGSGLSSLETAFEWLNKEVPGFHIDTREERILKNALKNKIEIEKIIKTNQEIYKKRWNGDVNTLKGAMFTPGLYEGEYKPLQFESVE